MTLSLDESHDIHLGNLNSIGIATEGDAAAQGILTRLRLFRGEWYLNVEAGTPWYQKVLVPAADIRSIEIELKRQINSAPDVTGIRTFNADFNRATRNITITFEANTIFGSTGILEFTL